MASAGPVRASLFRRPSGALPLTYVSAPGIPEAAPQPIQSCGNRIQRVFIEIGVTAVMTEAGADAAGGLNCSDRATYLRQSMTRLRAFSGGLCDTDHLSLKSARQRTRLANRFLRRPAKSSAPATCPSDGTRKKNRNRASKMGPLLRLGITSSMTPALNAVNLSAHVPMSSEEGALLGLWRSRRRRSHRSAGVVLCSRRGLRFAGPIRVHRLCCDKSKVKTFRKKS